MDKPVSFYDIYEKYPLLFPKNCIKCEPGWIDIIDQMCSAIQVYIENEISDTNVEFEFKYIREKYGVLDIGGYGGDDITSLLTKACERMSYATCEYCGNTPAELYCSSKHKQWSHYRTLCLERAIDLYYYRLYKM